MFNGAALFRVAGRFGDLQTLRRLAHRLGNVRFDQTCYMFVPAFRNMHCVDKDPLGASIECMCQIVERSDPLERRILQLFHRREIEVCERPVLIGQRVFLGAFCSLP